MLCLWLLLSPASSTNSFIEPFHWLLPWLLPESQGRGPGNEVHYLLKIPLTTYTYINFHSAVWLAFLFLFISTLQYPVLYFISKLLVFLFLFISTWQYPVLSFISKLFVSNSFSICATVTNSAYGCCEVIHVVPTAVPHLNILREATARRRIMKTRLSSHTALVFLGMCAI